MAGFVQRVIPVRFTVFAGDLASQPLVFAHLLDTNPDLDLDEVEVIQGPATARLKPLFETQAQHAILTALGTSNTCVLVPDYAGHVPLDGTHHLRPLGQFDGQITRMVPEGSP